MNRLFVVGLGLIGASIAQASRNSRQYTEVVGLDQCLDSAHQAVEMGVVDRYLRSFDDLAREFSKDDVLMVAVPSLAFVDVFRALKPCVAKGGVITDAASVKGAVVEAAQKAWGQLPSRFVPGHPIAGSEKSGVTAVNPLLFANRRVIVTPLANTEPEALSKVLALWQGVGAEVIEMDVVTHDRVLGATSHLPHAIAYSLVDTLANDSANEDIFKYAAGGFKDFTRIASSDPTMWHDIMIANREAVLEAIDLFANNLDRLRAAVDQGDSEAIFSIFTRAREAREQFLQIEQQGSAAKEV